MKRIGILGGLSAESTAEFYRLITRAYIEQFGTPDYPEMVVYSVRFQTMLGLATQQQWDRFADGLVEGLRALAQAGADFAVIAANMPHRVFDQVVGRVSIPLLHIADAVAQEARGRGYHRVALMGTQATMAAPFYPERLGRHHIECFVPGDDDQAAIQEIIEQELVRGILTEKAEARYVSIIRTLQAAGAEAVILGCTEIPLLISDDNSPLPVLDSTRLFALRTLAEALESGA